jgi:hypothetical protein
MVYLNYGRALQLLIQDLIDLIKKGPMNFQMLNRRVARNAKNNNRE